MPYITDRVVHDADAHVFEAPGWLDPWVDPDIRDRLEAYTRKSRGVVAHVEAVRANYDDPDYRAKDEEEILLRKGFAGLGAFVKEERPRALDLLGVASQLIFTTAGLGPLAAADRGDDPDVAYGVARAHNRAMADFCAVDARLLPVLHVPLMDLHRAVAFAGEAIAMGAAALMLPSACPQRHSPSHVALDPLWAQAEEAGVPIVFHVGGGKAINPTYKENGLPPVKDFTGGDGNFTSVSFMAIPDAPMHTLSTMIFDGVLDRFPSLRFGVIEQGASWVPGWMRSMDSAADAFVKNEERLRNLSMRPSEFVRRQIRVTPYPHEPAGWVVQNAGSEVCLFSSDYPHTEGGRNPMKRFEASLDGCTDDEKDRFYRRNFEDLMGRALDRVTAPA
ncbi:MAG TPA: amidohydrolase family protein [Acidimicrobiales bacterium]|nr:amidohydrolase family protein [Acidimicrobiales bacterium]